MKLSLLAGSALILSSHAALAGNVIIENEFVRAGLNELTGTLGSGGNTRPGLQYDSTGMGDFPTDGEQGDYLTPGSPFEGFTVKIDNDGSTTSYTNNNGGGTDITGGAWIGTPTASSAIWAATKDSVFNIQNTYSLPTGQQFIDISTKIDALTDMDTLWFGRFVDPDAMPESGDTSATDNALGYGVIPQTNVVFSEATVSRYALGLYTGADSGVGAGISDSWSTDPELYFSGGDYVVGNGDDTIGLGFKVVGVTTGDIMTFDYAYIFGPSAFTAAETAVEEGAGGAIPREVPGCTVDCELTDVGSATDAASTPDPVITEVLHPTLPTIVSSIDHHEASDDGAVQTIDIETTTTTTTPWLRTTTVGEEVTAEEVFNVVDLEITDRGVTGRIDQLATLAEIGSSLNRTLVVESGISFGTLRSSAPNGYSSESSRLTFGGEKQLTDGLSFSAAINILSTNLTGVDGSGAAKSTHFRMNISKAMPKGDITLSFNRVKSDYTYSRTIGDFANAGSTNGIDTWGNVTFTGNNKTVRPVFGYTQGTKNIAAYLETGSIQSIRTVDSLKRSYGFATIGFQADIGVVKIEALHHTDNMNQLTIGMDFDMKPGSNLFVDTALITNGEIKTGSVTAGFNLQF